MTFCSHLIHVEAYWHILKITKWKISLIILFFPPSFYRNMQDECMKSCVWEQQTWVMKKKPESTVWKWRRGYLDLTGWDFNHHSFRVQCAEGQNVHVRRNSEYKMPSCIQINLNVNLSVLLSNKNPVCSPPPFVSLTLQLFTVGRKIAHVRHTLDRLTALYCHCLLCYLFSSRNSRKIDLQSCENW